MRTGHLAPPVLLALLAACASAPAPDPGTPEEPWVVEHGDGEVSLAIRAGGEIPMTEFVKIAQRVTGRPIAYRASDLEGAPGVRFVGTMRIPDESFFSFFQTMLHVSGFACSVHGNGGTEVVEVVRQPLTRGSSS